MLDSVTQVLLESVALHLSHRALESEGAAHNVPGSQTWGPSTGAPVCPSISTEADHVADVACCPGDSGQVPQTCVFPRVLTLVRVAHSPNSW